MEWKRVRNWLILLVLAVDLILAGNLALQALNLRQTHYQAAQDAVDLARSRGVELSLETVLRMPETMPVYVCQRSDRMEQQTAEALLGPTLSRESPGGGVTIYWTATGQASFRRGGALELELPWSGSFGAEGCIRMLEQAGLPMEDVQSRTQSGTVELVQSQEGYPVFNDRLLCAVQAGTLRVRGRWLLPQELLLSGESLSRAQLVLALCDLLEARDCGPLSGLSAGYYLQSQDAQSLTLEPVWAVDTSQGQLILSCVTGKALRF